MFFRLRIWRSVVRFLDSAWCSYLTNNMPAVERFPLSFKSQFSGNHFHHIVLGVHSGGRFGALGMSRREDLMFKPLEFRTLLDLVQEFEGAYRGYWHTLRKVKIGQYVSHDPHSVEQIEWKHSILDVDKLTKEELRKELERHTRDMRLKVEWRRWTALSAYQIPFDVLSLHAWWHWFELLFEEQSLSNAVLSSPLMLI